jgi:hypothetical protein
VLRYFLGATQLKNRRLVDATYLGIRFEVIIIEVECEEISQFARKLKAVPNFVKGF